MKIVAFGARHAEQTGILIGDEIVPLLPSLTALGIGPLETNTLIALWPGLAEVVQHAIQKGRVRYPGAGMRLGAPVPRPGKIIGVGLNYRSYVSSVVKMQDLPKDPVLFLKPLSSLNGPNDPLIMPRESNDVEGEVEIAVVIGKAGHRISAAAALSHVMGYTIANDMTARDVFIGESAKSVLFLQMTRGKGFVTFCPTGPWLVTRDEIADVSQLELELSVNGVVRQAGPASDMITTIPELIAAASAAMPLMPGDLILSGSPPRRAAPPDVDCSIKPGAVLSTKITGLGAMHARVIADQGEAS